MKELGEYLKETRIKNGVSLDEVSADLEIDEFLLESIEEGNTRAFKDVLGIKDKVKSYAKYLGLDPDEIMDEFNDFLFEHTSKISLNDILEAEKKNAKSEDKSEKKPLSPYTIIKPKKINVKKIVLAAFCFFAIIIISILILSNFIPKREKVTNELMIKGGTYEKVEFTK